MLVTDKLGSYRVGHRDVMPLVPHDTTQYANNRAEVSHERTRQRERQMRGFTSSAHAMAAVRYTCTASIQNLFRVASAPTQVGARIDVASSIVHRVG